MVKLLQVFQDEQRSLDLAIKADLLYNDGDCANLNYPGKHQIVPDTNSVHGKKLRCSFRDDNKTLFYNSVFRRSKLLVKKILYLIFLWATRTNRDITSKRAQVNK